MVPTPGWVTDGVSVKRLGPAPESAASLTYHLYYGMKSQLNMHKRPEVRRKRLEELCQQWHIQAAV